VQKGGLIQSHTVPVAIQNAPVNRPTTSNEVTSNINCYNCRGREHISRDCPQPQRAVKCTGCGSDQHHRSRFPASFVEQYGRGDVGQAFRVDTTLTVHKANPFVKTVHWNNVQLTGMIDTVPQCWYTNLLL
jgi:hypothetical protein